MIIDQYYHVSHKITFVVLPHLDGLYCMVKSMFAKQMLNMQAKKYFSERGAWKRDTRWGLPLPGSEEGSSPGVRLKGRPVQTGAADLPHPS